MRFSSRIHRPGFTLLEALGFIGTLIVCMLLGSTVLIGGMQTEQSASTAHRHTVQRISLAEQFRADVSGASAAPDSFAVGDDRETAGPHCLILARPDKTEVVYLWSGGELWRWETSAAGKITRRELPVGFTCTEVEFVREPGGKKGAALELITLRIKLAGPKGKPDRPVDLAAVLGGDRK